MKEVKAIPVRGLEGRETLRIPHCLDNLLIDGGEVVNPTHRQRFTPQKHYFVNVSGSNFCKRLSKPQGLMRSERLVTLKFHLIGSRTRDLLACSLAP
jgi:hypothetical protein